MPAKGLSPVEMKKMGKEISSVAKIVEVLCMTVNAFSDNSIETDQVLDYLQDVNAKGVRHPRALWVLMIVNEQVQVIFEFDARGSGKNGAGLSCGQNLF